MATEKVSLTLDRGLLKQARSRAGRRGLSSYLDSALRLKLQQDRLRTLLSDLEEAHGPVSNRVRSEVRREWPDDLGKASSKSRRR